MSQNHIRVIALAIVQHEGRLLVFKARSYAPDSYIYRPLGGGVEYGERGSDAVVREMREELGAELRDVRYLGTLENIFTYDGRVHHELVMLYAAQLVDVSLYERADLESIEADGTRFTCLWAPLADCASGALHLVPESLLDFLQSSTDNL